MRSFPFSLQRSEARQERKQDRYRMQKRCELSPDKDRKSQ